MNLELYINLIAGTIIAITGWTAAHRLTSSRDLKNKRRELRTSKLIEVYEKLDRSIGRQITAEVLCDIEDAVSILQLLGTKSDIESTIKAALALSGDAHEGSSKDAGLLVTHLRDSLREELGLEKYEGPFAIVRLNFDEMDPRVAVNNKKSK